MIKVFEAVKPEGHAREVLEFIKELGEKKKSSSPKDKITKTKKSK